jgi:antitoxin component of RelBE/YafQ-DinJ toxin-antitoxin module
MDTQLKMFGREASDLDWTICQFRIPIELKRDLALWCRQKGLTVSTYFRMVATKTLEDERTMHDPRQLQPITNAVREVQEYVPVIVKYNAQRNY